MILSTTKILFINFKFVLKFFPSADVCCLHAFDI